MLLDAAIRASDPGCPTPTTYSYDSIFTVTDQSRIKMDRKK